eukprot:TRINITY_DN1649_c1_g6_i1.p1 TRINITY_DN1649_c1_g6~~TRINITY_DN1649_c1_g6_i1.p1  ORF type:complete len:1207 (+),score=245.55 TRINITY_DN1649_c1_g6_i1:293-3622(+)
MAESQTIAGIPEVWDGTHGLVDKATGWGARAGGGRGKRRRGGDLEQSKWSHPEAAHSPHFPAPDSWPRRKKAEFEEDEEDGEGDELYCPTEESSGEASAITPLKKQRSQHLPRRAPVSHPCSRVPYLPFQEASLAHASAARRESSSEAEEDDFIPQMCNDTPLRRNERGRRTRVRVEAREGESRKGQAGWRSARREELEAIQVCTLSSSPFEKAGRSKADGPIKACTVNADTRQWVYGQRDGQLDGHIDGQAVQERERGEDIGGWPRLARCARNRKPLRNSSIHDKQQGGQMGEVLPISRNGPVKGDVVENGLVCSMATTEIVSAETVQWSECDLCFKWRILPPDAQVKLESRGEDMVEFRCDFLPGMNCSVPGVVCEQKQSETLAIPKQEASCAGPQMPPTWRQAETAPGDSQRNWDCAPYQRKRRRVTKKRATQPRGPFGDEEGSFCDRRNGNWAALVVTPNRTSQLKIVLKRLQSQKRERDEQEGEIPEEATESFSFGHPNGSAGIKSEEQEGGQHGAEGKEDGTAGRVRRGTGTETHGIARSTEKEKESDREEQGTGKWSGTCESQDRGCAEGGGNRGSAREQRNMSRHRAEKGQRNTEGMESEGKNFAAGLEPAALPSATQLVDSLYQEVKRGDKSGDKHREKCEGNEKRALNRRQEARNGHASDGDGEGDKEAGMVQERGTHGGDDGKHGKEAKRGRREIEDVLDTRRRGATLRSRADMPFDSPQIVSGNESTGVEDVKGGEPILRPKSEMAASQNPDRPSDAQTPLSGAWIQSTGGVPRGKRCANRKGLRLFHDAQASVSVPVSQAARTIKRGDASSLKGSKSGAGTAQRMRSIRHSEEPRPCGLEAAEAGEGMGIEREEEEQWEEGFVRDGYDFNIPPEWERHSESSGRRGEGQGASEGSLSEGGQSGDAGDGGRVWGKQREGDCGEKGKREEEEGQGKEEEEDERGGEKSADWESPCKKLASETSPELRRQCNSRKKCVPFPENTLLPSVGAADAATDQSSERSSDDSECDFRIPSEWETKVGRSKRKRRSLPSPPLQGDLVKEGPRRPLREAACVIDTADGLRSKQEGGNTPGKGRRGRRGSERKAEGRREGRREGVQV